VPRSAQHVQDEAALQRHPLAFRADLVGDAHPGIVRNRKPLAIADYCDDLR
jgi:hypothetical protein